MRAVSIAVLLALWFAGCGGETPESRGPGAGGRGGPNAGGAGWGGEEAPAAAVPVEVAPAMRRDISAFIETNGTLEAENEVDVVARVSAPIVELRVEEGMEVRAGEVLARLDRRELEARAEVSRVALEEARLARERAERLRASQLISPEEHEQALNRFDTAEAQYESDRLQLGYTAVEAPFRGLIIARYVNLAQQVSPGTPLFRLSDFDPLLCPIQVPERELPRLRVGQRARIAVEAWPGERFEARVLRISPVVDAATGTVKVTLEVAAGGRLRPGMFARVFLETEKRPGALVVPKAALSLESIGDTVYVAAGGRASRREVELGFREGDLVEVLSGVEEGEEVVVVGQDGLSEGTPLQVLGAAPGGADAAGGEKPAAAAGPDRSGGRPGSLEEMRESMRQRGMSEEEIERRLERIRQKRQDGAR